MHAMANMGESIVAVYTLCLSVSVFVSGYGRIHDDDNNNINQKSFFGFFDFNRKTKNAMAMWPKGLGKWQFIWQSINPLLVYSIVLFDNSYKLTVIQFMVFFSLSSVSLVGWSGWVGRFISDVR